MATQNSANQSNTGIQSLTSAGAFNGRTITGTSNQISVSNGDGTGGNPTLSLTSTIQVTGISFDSGSNTLSNYATGTFTPTVTNTGSAPSVSYTTQTGLYTRVGNKVFVVIQIQLSAYTAGTGNTQISSLPITSNSTTGNVSTGTVYFSSVTFGASVLYYVSTLQPSSTVLDLAGMRSASSTLNLVASGPSASSNITINQEYEV